MFQRKKRQKPGGKKPVKKPDQTSEEDSDGSLSDSNDETPEAAVTLAPGDNGKEWGKVVDVDLRKYIVAVGCRTLVSDSYFDNPPRRSTGMISIS